MSLKLVLKVIAFLLVASEAFAAPRTVFIQMFEWPWKDVAKECETYLGPAGFSAVQVSPPHEHIIWKENPWWVRYQVVSYKIESRSGTEAEFSDMVQRCKNAGVDIYVDAVINHMTGIAGGVGIAGSTFSHYDYPGIFQYQDFNHCNRNGNDNIVNYDDRFELQYCELLDLADLATSSEYVRNKIAEYMNRLLDLGVAGFRIDAAKHMPAEDLAAILAKLKRSSYIYSEVIYSPSGPVQYSEYLPFGDVMAYHYGDTLAWGVRSRNMNTLLHSANSYPASDRSVVFLTNHDLERWKSGFSYNGPENRDYRLAQVFLLAWPFGYPQLYSAYSYTDEEAGPPLDFHLRTLPIIDDNNECRAPWTCEHRLPEVAAMVKFRNETNDAFQVQSWWSNQRDVVAFSRGRKGFVAVNFGYQQHQGDFETTMPDGTYCNLLQGSYNLMSNTCQRGVTVSGGRIKATLPPQSALVLLQDSKVLSGITK